MRSPFSSRATFICPKAQLRNSQTKDSKYLPSPELDGSLHIPTAIFLRYANRPAGIMVKWKSTRMRIVVVVGVVVASASISLSFGLEHSCHAYWSGDWRRSISCRELWLWILVNLLATASILTIIVDLYRSGSLWRE